jgi:hypothetical protein
MSVCLLIPISIEIRKRRSEALRLAVFGPHSWLFVHQVVVKERKKTKADSHCTTSNYG